jgi:hypothetical protein
MLLSAMAANEQTLVPGYHFPAEGTAFVSVSKS